MSNRVKFFIFALFVIFIIVISSTSCKACEGEPLSYTAEDVYGDEVRVYTENSRQNYINAHEEYSTAAYIYLYLSDKGFNDYVACGIIGNMMAEVGGQTLRLPWDTKTKGYYGLCMWSKRWHPDVWGCDLDGQLDYLTQTIKEQFDYCGEMFGCTYDEFLEIDDCRYAAKMFMVVYERCSMNSVYKRMDNAEKAYEYLVEVG